MPVLISGAGRPRQGATELEADIDLTLVDFNVWYLFRPDSRLSFTIGAGPGWAWADGDIQDATGTSISGGKVSDDSFTANIALGPIIKLGERANLRPLTRFRYFDEREDDEVDKEITLGIQFPLGGKRHETVAAAPVPAPKPVVTPPAKCPDGDNDGVCNAADQCPDSPAGTRVGAAGCDCDYTLQLQFALNSAELTEADKVALDGLAAVLKNPKLSFVAGEIEGHTDSTGTEAYNQSLSTRRAETVANYLQANGVTLSSQQFSTKGWGETKPIADNSTAAGRAQNRRVVVRRTDCGAT